MQDALYLSNNRYKLVNVLGTGGMAIVFKAEDTRLKVEKAIKIPNHQCLSHPVVRGRFETEASTMAKLRHKHIVIIYDIIDEKYQIDEEESMADLVYMVMEMLPGGSLQDRIDDHGMLHPQQVITATTSMLLGLGFAHQNNVVHRDVKVENMLIGSNNELKVSDFGIAQIDGGAGVTKSGATMGTLAFMSPEQKLNSRSATFISDLYSAGASFFNMLTGKHPSELYALDMQEEAFVGLSEAVIEFLKKACNISPKERYQSADEMIEALKELRNAFEPLPDDATPFFVPREDKEDTEEELEYRNFKINSIWKTQINPPTDITDFRRRRQITPPKTATETICFDDEESTANPTSLDDLGIDLMGDADEVTGSHSLGTLLPAQNNFATTNTSEPETPEKKGFPMAIVGVIAALLIGVGVFAFSQTDSNNGKQGETENNVLEEQTLVEKEVIPPASTQEEILTNSSEKQEEKKADVKTETKKDNPPVQKKTENKTTKTKTTPKRTSKPKTTSVKKKVKAAPPVEEAPKSNKKGSIVLISKPWSHVTVNGKKASCKGKSANTIPCNLSLSVGTHKIGFKSGVDSTIVRTKSIRIAEGKNSAICWDLGTNSRCN